MAEVKMGIGDFLKFLMKIQANIVALKQEMDKIYFDFNNFYVNQIGARQDKIVDSCREKILANMNLLKPGDVRRLEETKKTETENFKKRLVDLQNAVKDAGAAKQDIEAKASGEIDELRKQNPEFDKREEALKADIADLDNKIKQQNEELKRTSGFFTWIFNLGKIRKLRFELNDTIKQYSDTEAKIEEVRKLWEEKNTAVTKDQKDLQDQWQKAVIQLAQRKQDLEYLQKNFDTVVLKSAINTLLKDPDVPLDAGDETVMKDLKSINQEKREYEEGLKEGVEISALLEGLQNGLKNIVSSVQALKEEEDTNSAYLQKLDLDLPPQGNTFLDASQALKDKLSDTEFQGKHPSEFSAIIKDAIGHAFRTENIQAFFDSLGSALKTAAKKWG